MLHNVFEGSTLTLLIGIDSGTPKEAKVTFLVTQGTTEKSVPGTMSETGLQASAEYVAPAVDEVDKTKDSYSVTYRAEVDSEKFEASEYFRVWRHKLSIKAVGTDDQPYTKGFEFRVRQDREITGKGTTSQEGSGGLVLQKKGEFELEAVPPFVVKWKAPNQTAERTGTVERRFVAQFLSPLQKDPKKPIEQMVNLECTDGRDGKGPVVSVEVGAKDDEGTTKAKLFVQVRFGRESKRTEPAPTVQEPTTIAKVDEKGALFKGHVLLGEDGAPATLLVHLGIAGGDTCTIEIGGTEACEDATLSFVNWRQLWYNFRQPAHQGPDRLSDFPPNQGGPGLSAAALHQLDGELARAFVRLTLKSAAPFDDPLEEWKHNVVDAKLFGKNSGQLALALTEDQAQNLLNDLYGSADDPRAVSLVCVDQMLKLSQFVCKHKIERETELMPGPSTEVRLLPKAIADYPGVPRGNPAIYSLEWKASDWFDDSVQAWKPIQSPSDPAYEHSQNSIKLQASEIAEHVQILRWDRMKLLLPRTKDRYPGALYLETHSGDLKAGGKKIKIEFLMKAISAVYGAEGFAIGGNIAISNFVGDAKAQGVANCVLHELGHCMGQAYLSQDIDPQLGPQFGRATKIPGVDFPAGVPDGDVYVGHGHTGNHCANGLEPDQKKMDSFPKVRGKCIMYGAGQTMTPDGGWATTAYGFCENCTTYLCAEQLDDVRRDWKA